MRIALCTLATFSVVASMSAQSLRWTQLAPPQSPAGRAWHAMAFDAARGRTVLHGGYAGTEFGDTWTFDGLTWTPQPQAALPSRRWHAMAYDAARQRVVMYGGQASGSYPTQTYLWDGANWTAVTTATNPGAMAKHGMCYDAARQRVVMFGNVFGNAVWEWDGTNWASIAPAVAPLPRNETALVYDAARQRTVLYGGQLGPAGNFAYANDTWEWDGASWTQVATAHVPPGNRYPWGLMAFDATRGTVVLHSGVASFVGNDTWEYDGTDWSQVATTNTLLNRVSGAMAFDTARQSLVLFGGASNLLPGGYHGDTWISYLLASASSYGVGCGAPALHLAPDAARRPILGQTAGLTVQNVPSAIVSLAAGWSRTGWAGGALPFSLAQFGMPGCDLLVSAEFMGLGAAPAGPGTYDCSYALPNVPAMLGREVFLQAYSLAPGQNALGIIVSNGVQWRFGAQ